MADRTLRLAPEEARIALQQREKGHRWIEVWPLVARGHPLFGVRGWLLAVVVLFALGVARHIAYLAVTLSYLLAGPGENISSKGATHVYFYMGEWSLNIYGLVVSIVTMFLIVFVYRRTYIAVISLCGILIFLETFGAAASFLFFGLRPLRINSESLQIYSLMAAPYEYVLHIPALVYLIVSKRVQVTLAGKIHIEDKYWNTVSATARKLS